MRFTPAGAAEHASRSITVAVRVDENSAQAMSVRSAIEAAMDQVAGESRERILAPTRYKPRGRARFTKASPARPPRHFRRRRPMPASPISRTSARPRAPRKSQAASPRASIRTCRPSPPPNRASLPTRRSISRASYRLTRNLDVTAGVRYSQDRNRLTTLVEPGKQDNQAVYIGTQFRF
jgi:hypothetical protein